MKVRKLGKDDALSIAKLHHISFNDFFLTSLGEAFLYEFYKAILLQPSSVNLGIYVNSCLAGFAIGTKNNDRFYKSLLPDFGFKMLIAALPELLINPAKLFRLIKSFKSGGYTNGFDSKPCLLSICVSPEYTSKGIGKSLIAAFERELLQNNLNESMLTTDKHNNDYVNNFYKSNNYICVQSFYQGKREMNLYHKKLST